MQEISAWEIVLQRLARNGLSVPFTSVQECVHALAGIQSQFQQWAEVSIMNRYSGAVSTGELSRLYQDHTLINLWGQRHTLHTYVKEDWDAVCDVFEPALSGKNHANKRLPEDFTRLMERIAGQCSLTHPLSRTRVVELIEEHRTGLHAEEESLVYMLIILSCARGILFGLPEKPAIKTFIGRGRVFENPWQAVEDRSLASLDNFILRYFRYYGPASLADFSHWSGLAQTTAKKRLALLQDDLTACSHNGREYYTHGEAGTPPSEDGLFLLGKFDPLFVSYRHKDWIIPEKLQKQVWRSAGWVEALVIEGDKAMGTWRHTLKGKKMSLEVSQFSKIKTASRKRLKTRAEKLAHFWEKQLDTVDFV